jgi:hypothetical protein
MAREKDGIILEGGISVVSVLWTISLCFIVAREGPKGQETKPWSDGSFGSLLYAGRDTAQLTMFPGLVWFDDLVAWRWTSRKVEGRKKLVFILWGFGREFKEGATRRPGVTSTTLPIPTLILVTFCMFCHGIAGMETLFPKLVHLDDLVA